MSLQSGRGEGEVGAELGGREGEVGAKFGGREGEGRREGGWYRKGSRDDV